jgi:RNA polymerase sigma-70 factor (sigma-E family)
MGTPTREGGLRKEDDAGFREFARDRSLALRRTAYLLCLDWHLAEDLVQTALIKLYRVWPRLRHSESIDNYARRVLTRCWLDEGRRTWRRRERRDGVVPEPASDRDDPALVAAASGLSDVLLRALAEIGPRQRAVVVLRYCLDLPIADVAGTLGLTPGTVKSQTARGLDALRAIVEEWETEELPTRGRSR